MKAKPSLAPTLELPGVVSSFSPSNRVTFQFIDAAFKQHVSKMTNGGGTSTTAKPSSEREGPSLAQQYPGANSKAS